MADVMGVPAQASSSGIGRRFVALFCVLALVAMVVSLAPISAKLCWNVAWTASAAAAVGGTLIARSAASPVSRARWTLWAAAATSWLVGQLAWDAFVAFGFLRSPNIADIGYWGFAVLVIISLVQVRGRPSPQQAVTAAEMLPLIAAVTALTLALLWSDVSQSSLPSISRLSALAYPAVYVAAALLTLQAIIGGSLRRDRSPASLLILGGIVAQALAFILWSHQLLRGTNAPGSSLLSPLWAIERSRVCSVDVGDARGWNVWPLENGDWAWNAWTAASLGLPRSGTEPTEAEAKRAAQQEIERMLAEARAAALTRRELPVRDDRGTDSQPQS